MCVIHPDNINCPVINNEGSEMVRCSSLINCGNMLGMMTKKQCCIDRTDGMAFTTVQPGAETCHPCIGKTMLAHKQCVSSKKCLGLWADTRITSMGA